MTAHLTTLDPVSSSISSQTILAKEGFHCSLLYLQPDDTTPLQPSHAVEEHLLFVVDGEVTVSSGPVNTIVRKDSALLIPKGHEHIVEANLGVPAKILRVDVPPRQIVTPPLVAIERRRR